MSSRRTKLLFWLSTFPPLFAGGAVAWVMIYPYYLRYAHRATFFVVFHLHPLRVLVASTILFLCGLISFSFDRRNELRK